MTTKNTSFPVPPVCTAEWTDDDWTTWTDHHKKTEVARACIIATIGLLCILFSSAECGATETGKVNVNTASSEQLQWLPGVGEVTADNVLYAREQGFTFSSVDDLTQVHGIGEKTAEKLAPHVVFEGETTATGPIGKKAKGSTSSKFKRPETTDG
jgi:competence ComEA-like helix-hairpin-helix protein